jgi:hypothetical protein
MRKLLGVAIGAATLFGAAPAMAQADVFGKQMDVAFGADRLFGISFAHRRDEDRCGPGNRREDCEHDTTGFGLGWRGRDAQTPFDVPRFAFDIFVIDSLSVGGSVGYASYSTDRDPGPAIAGDGGDVDRTEWLFSPRVGYVIMFTDNFGFWPRGGITYHSRKDDPDGRRRDREHGWALTFEAMFVWTPVQHFGFAFGWI